MSDDKKMTREEVERKVKDRIAGECGSMFFSLISLGYSTKEAGEVIFAGVEEFSKAVSDALKENLARQKEKTK